MRQRTTTSSLHTSAPQRTYRYGYDSLSRLTRARYSDSEGGAGHYDTRYSYDLNGNLTSLVRRGALSLSSAGTPSSYGAIDSLTLEYAGNRLRSVSDAAAGPHYQGAFHFVDGADEDEEYRYDLNGNTVTDLNRGILSSRFDTAGHPARMDFADGSSTSYLYDDAGTKLRTLHRVASVPVAVPGSQGPALTETVTDYCAGFVYEDSLLTRINLDGAYLSYTGANGSRLSTPEYHFYLRDHLGNNRVDVAADGRICQVTDYYPYGLPMASSRNAAAQRWLFGGKELDRISGLDLYDFEARAYDPALARFTSPDALASDSPWNTPYLYCSANPLNRIDPDGNFDFINIASGQTYGTIAVFSQKKTVLSKNYDRIISDAFKTAKVLGVPIIRVDNISDYADAMKCLDDINTSTLSYSLTSHGKPGKISIGDDIVTADTDVSLLKDGLEGTIVFFNACESADGEKGNSLIENFSEATNSITIGSCHTLKNKYTYRGGCDELTENPENAVIERLLGKNTENIFKISVNGEKATIIYNVSISKTEGVKWKPKNQIHLGVSPTTTIFPKK